jgi:hypothetical protein
MAYAADLKGGKQGVSSTSADSSSRDNSRDRNVSEQRRTSQTTETVPETPPADDELTPGKSAAHAPGLAVAALALGYIEAGRIDLARAALKSYLERAG